MPIIVPSMEICRLPRGPDNTRNTAGTWFRVRSPAPCHPGTPSQKPRLPGPVGRDRARHRHLCRASEHEVATIAPTQRPSTRRRHSDRCKAARQTASANGPSVARQPCAPCHVAPAVPHHLGPKTTRAWTVALNQTWVPGCQWRSGCCQWHRQLWLGAWKTRSTFCSMETRVLPPDTPCRNQSPRGGQFRTTRVQGGERPRRVLNPPVPLGGGRQKISSPAPSPTMTDAVAP
ncbi:hypothetical protein QBC39DRAFT_429790, partial [Podospora conica]